MAKAPISVPLLGTRALMQAAQEDRTQFGIAGYLLKQPSLKIPGVSFCPKTLAPTGREFVGAAEQIASRLSSPSNGRDLPSLDWTGRSLPRQTEDMTGIFKVVFQQQTISMVKHATYDPEAKTLSLEVNGVEARKVGTWGLGKTLHNQIEATSLRTLNIVSRGRDEIQFQRQYFGHNPLGRLFSSISLNPGFVFENGAVIHIVAENFPVTPGDMRQPADKQRLLRWPQARNGSANPDLFVCLHQRAPYTVNSKIKEQITELIKALCQIIFNAKNYIFHLTKIKFHFAHFNFQQLTEDEQHELAAAVMATARELDQEIKNIENRTKRYHALSKQTTGTLEVSFSEMDQPEKRVFKTSWSTKRKPEDEVPLEILTETAADLGQSWAAYDQHRAAAEQPPHVANDPRLQPAQEGLATDYDPDEAHAYSASTEPQAVSPDADGTDPSVDFFDADAFVDDMFTHAGEALGARLTAEQEAEHHDEYGEPPAKRRKPRA
ncbi:MAG: hypothetical protein V4623_09290 [Pseudomonadota bacterium]